jgi:hypothetical protein
MVASSSPTMIAGSLFSCIAGFHHSCRLCPTRDARALAQSRLSMLLALEIAPTGRATADRNEAARVDPADERWKFALGRATHSRRTCVYRKFKRGRNGGEVRRGWRVI